MHRGHQSRTLQNLARTAVAKDDFYSGVNLETNLPNLPAPKNRVIQKPSPNLIVRLSGIG